MPRPGASAKAAMLQKLQQLKEGSPEGFAGGSQGGEEEDPEILVVNSDASDEWHDDEVRAAVRH